MGFSSQTSAAEGSESWKVLARRLERISVRVPSGLAEALAKHAGREADQTAEDVGEMTLISESS